MSNQAHLLTLVKKLMIQNLKLVKLLEYQNIKNIFAKVMFEEAFVLKKIKNSLLGTYVINLLTDKEIVGTFNKKELQNTNQKEFRVEKVIMRKGDKLYVKWKGYDNLFNSWIDKDINI